MKRNYLLALVLAFLMISFSSYSQEMRVHPYLQNGESNSINILWETNENEESIIKWGEDLQLINTTTGISIDNEGQGIIHKVKLEGLKKLTRYYYSASTGTAISDTYSFKTAPFASDEQSFRMIAMSDMQKDGSNPNKFAEIIEEGIITYIDETFSGDIPENLGLIIIPGDLVVNGNTYSQWSDHFFGPAKQLFSQVPLYPVLGNHEVNTAYFFNYFELPQNGSPGFEEHWWYKDYGNVRIIGLDSNPPFNSNLQLSWLDSLLTITCSTDSIDFVFAQLHHPFKSELWLPGESDFTGEVVNLLEEFTTNCNKPSIHFFGHTHGYSRGQSKDHKHLWINVATAGGAIDNWGEFPQFDYDEFSVSQDEWGFVTIDVNAGEDPSFTIKRISRGNETLFKDNWVTDSLTVRKNGISPDTPTGIFPNDIEVLPECVILKASSFSSPNMLSLHGQSQWQISASCDDFSNPVSEIWKNHENQYFGTDTNIDHDLSEQRIINLEEEKNYCWRVRYRDRELNWSTWSEPIQFETMQSDLSPNLVINPGAESGTFGWTILEGNLESLLEKECDGIHPHSGDKFFAVGGVCDDAPLGLSIQYFDLSSYSDSINTGNSQVNYGGFLSNYNGSDLPELRIVIYNEQGNPIDSSLWFSTLNNNWTMVDEWMTLLRESRFMQLQLKGTRNAGNDNDSYFDDLFVRLGKQSENCDQYTVSNRNPEIRYKAYDIIPNPIITKGIIQTYEMDATHIRLHVYNVLGIKQTCNYQSFRDEIILERDGLIPGIYFFYLESKSSIIGSGKFIVE